MFSRVTVGFPMSPQVTQFELTRGLSWRTVVDGHPDSKAYHGWVITATATGCRVLTEETHKARSSSKNSDARTPVRSTATTRFGKTSCSRCGGHPRNTRTQSNAR
jgi:hypothetical protein